MPGMNGSDPPRKATGLIGITNVGLSFLMPFLGVQFLLGFAWMYYHGPRWIDAAFVAPGLFVLGFYGISAGFGIINAVGYYRKKYRR